MEIKRGRLGFAEITIVETGYDRAQNDRILKEVYAKRDKWTFSHRIKGRWENTYIPLRAIPSARTILSSAVQAGKEVFGKDLAIPHRGTGFNSDRYWFNIAGKGESTGLHNHSASACVSGVYYLRVPENSGNIVFRKEDLDDVEYAPREGVMLLFPSELNHAVKENQNEEERVSLAFNLQSLPLVLDAPEDAISHF